MSGTDKGYCGGVRTWSAANIFFIQEYCKTLELDNLEWTWEWALAWYFWWKKYYCLKTHIIWYIFSKISSAHWSWRWVTIWMDILPSMWGQNKQQYNTFWTIIVNRKSFIPVRPSFTLTLSMLGKFRWHFEMCHNLRKHTFSHVHPYKDLIMCAVWSVFT